MRGRSYGCALRDVGIGAIREGDNGVLINAATNTSFTYKDECVKLGPHVGHDPEATRAATVAVTDFLRAVLKP